MAIATPKRTLKLPRKYLVRVQQLLRAVVPNTEVLAYGSRVDGGAHDASDLDLVLRTPCNPSQPNMALHDLRTAFRESDLPIRVDVHDWASIPESFRREIDNAHVILQGQKGTDLFSG